LLGGANRDRLCDPDHTIERLDGDGDFALLSEGASTHPGADQRFVATDRGLDEVASAVADRLLPPHAAARSDELDMLVTLARRVSSIPAHLSRST
jgi:hypothetical protein